MLVGVDRIEQRKIRKGVSFMSIILVADRRSIVAIKLVNIVRRGTIVEAGNHQSAHVATSTNSSRVAHKRTIDVVEHVAPLFKQRFGIDTKILKARKSNQYFFGGEIDIGDEKK